MVFVGMRATGNVPLASRNAVQLQLLPRRLVAPRRAAPHRMVVAATAIQDLLATETTAPASSRTEFVGTSCRLLTGRLCAPRVHSGAKAAQRQHHHQHLHLAPPIKAIVNARMVQSVTSAHPTQTAQQQEVTV
jgi:hypothetical protein